MALACEPEQTRRGGVVVFVLFTDADDRVYWSGGGGKPMWVVRFFGCR
jgi:hypothetical protein